ncbi:MAG: hypothetical protein ABIS27_00040 [Longimicrobiales bacterium]
MADQGSRYKHSDSDRKLDQSAQPADAENNQDAGGPAGPGHDPEKIKKHDDTGKDRLFEGREQHDDAEMASEKTRLAKDVDRHHHPVDNDVSDSGTAASSTDGS